MWTTFLDKNLSALQVRYKYTWTQVHFKCTWGSSVNPPNIFIRISSDTLRVFLFLSEDETSGVVKNSFRKCSETQLTRGCFGLNGFFPHFSHQFSLLRRGSILKVKSKSESRILARYYGLMQISRLRFKQSRISMLIPDIYVLGRLYFFFLGGGGDF